MSTVNRRRRRGLVLAATLWPFVLVAPVAAQAPREEPRLALVIGNSAYREAPLRNPVNDARAMAQRLRELGFTVIAHENATKRTMEAAIIEFGRRLGEGGVGAFYYAGHGLQVRGRNYLVPVDCEIDDEASTRVAAVDVELLLEQMNEARNRINLVVLDACRNNPFERRMRGGSRGLAAVDAARGTLIAYATVAGQLDLGAAAPWQLLLLIEDGQVSLLTSLLWCALLGGLISCVAAAGAGARALPPLGPPGSIRGAGTHAGPGALGGTPPASRPRR